MTDSIDLAYLARQNEKILAEIAALRDEVGAMRNDLTLQSRKLDKLSVDLMAVRGRVRNLETSVETIARVISADAGI